jgi:ABC-2 type transport system permease protein
VSAATPESASTSREAVPPLRVIRGPAAWSGDSRRFWRLVFYLARSEFIVKYKGSALGYLWSLISPLLLFGILYLVFTKIVRFGSGVENYGGFLLLNIMLFQFFSDATTQAVGSIVNREALVRKMEFPRLAIPLSVVLSATFTLALDLVVVIGFLLLSGVHVMVTWLLLPVLIVWLYVLTVGASLLLSTLFVSFRDTAQIWLVLTRVMFYASPILFPIEFFPSALKPLLLLNPLAPLFAQSRVWIVDPNAETFSQAFGGAIYWIYPMLILLGTVMLGAWVFQREAPNVAEQL